MRLDPSAALRLLLLLLPLTLTKSRRFDSPSVGKKSSWNKHSVLRMAFVAVRGGSEIDLDGSVDEMEADVEDLDFVDEEEDEVEIDDELEGKDEKNRELDPKLTKSTLQSTVKVQTKETSSKKAAVSSALKVNKSKKRKWSLTKTLRLPYIIRACMNPFTVFAMTKAYFASLFNLNFMKEQDSSQNLRSAMEEKAKKKGGDSPRKGKRQMRPGQAKTLSDLPQLSA